MQLHEQYRPQSWADVLGQEKAVKQLRALAQRRLAGKAFWLSGPSGTGKTTLARLLAAEVASDMAVEEIDATALTVAGLKELEEQSHFAGFGKGGRAYVINEAHGLRRDVIRQMLVFLERLKPHVVVIFTTTKAGQQRLFDDYDDGSPLMSRCIKITLQENLRGLAAEWAPKARTVAESLGLGGKPLAAYQDLVLKENGNLRACWNAIDAGEMIPEPTAPQAAPVVNTEADARARAWRKALASVPAQKPTTGKSPFEAAMDSF